jgi:retron-type reverse transcriptase
MAEEIMIPKHGKPPNEVTSYRPISLILSHQFGFRNKHATTDQIHRITYEEEKNCSAIFLDIAQAYDKVRHVGLMNKLKNTLPRQFTQILESYTTGRMFWVKQEEAYSTIKEIKAGLPQGSVLGPILYLLYTWDIRHEEDISTATFANDTAILAVGYSSEEKTTKLQEACIRIND